MTINEAILHCREIIENNSICEECKDEHKQLLEWLIELREIKESKND